MMTRVRSLVLGTVILGLTSVSATAQTALRLGTNDLFQSESAVLTDKGQKFLEAYIKRQECKNFNIVGYTTSAPRNDLVGERARVIRGLALRYEMPATVKFERADAEAAKERRVEIFPEECVAFATNSGGGGLGAALPAGLAAIVILGVIGGGTSPEGGGTSAPHTN